MKVSPHEFRYLLTQGNKSPTKDLETNAWHPCLYFNHPPIKGHFLVSPANLLAPFPMRMKKKKKI